MMRRFLQSSDQPGSGPSAWNVLMAILGLAPSMARLPYDLRHQLTYSAAKLALLRRRDSTAIAAGLLATNPELGVAGARAIARQANAYRPMRIADLVSVATCDAQELKSRLSFVGENEVRQTVALGRGVLVMNMHLGPHWLVPFILAAHDLPVVSVGFDGAWLVASKKLSSKTSPLLNAVEMMTIPDRAAPAKCVARLRQKAIVLSYGDITLPGRDDRRTLHQRGNRTYEFDLVDTLRLAEVAGSPVVVTYLRSAPGRRLLLVAERVQATSPADVLEAVAHKIIDQLEAVPDQCSYWAYNGDKSRADLMHNNPLSPDTRGPIGHGY